MEEIIVIGNGNISKILSSYLKKKFNIIAYASKKKFIKSKKINNKPVYSLEELKKKFSPKKYKIITAIGYLEMNNVRKKIFEDLKSEGYNFVNYIDNSAQVPNDVIIRENNILLDNVSINPGSKIGNGNIIWSNSVISHNVRLNHFNWVSSGTVISGDTSIGNCNFFGSNSIISNNSFIANSIFIGAGALVTGKVRNESTIINSTSKKIEIKSLDFLKYLKNEQ